MIKNFFLIIFILIITAMPVRAEHSNTSEPIPNGNARGIVVSLFEKSDAELSKAFGGDQKVQIVKIKLLSGRLKNKIVETENQITQNPAYNIDLKKGDKVILVVEKQNGHYFFYIADKERSPIVLILTGFTLLLLLLLGGEKAAYSILILFSLIGLVFVGLFPTILRFGHAVPFTVLTASIVSILSALLTEGVNKKALCSAIGTILSLLITTSLFILMIKAASLTGYTITTIELAETNINVDFKGLLVASVIIATLGFLMETANSMTNYIAELPYDIDKKERFKSSIGFGQGIVGPKVNSLLLAYLGFMLPVFLIFPTVHLTKFINLNAVVAEILAGLTGCIGILLCVPITIIISELLIKKAPDEETF